MKKCPQCKEEYPEFADTCPKCYIDLDTGEVIEIDKNINLERLKHAFKELTFRFKVALWNMAILFATFMIGISINRPIIGNVFVSIFIVSLIIAIVIMILLRFSIYRLHKIMGETSVVTWFFLMFSAYSIYNRTKEILKIAEIKKQSQ